MSKKLLRIFRCNQCMHLHLKPNARTHDAHAARVKVDASWVATFLGKS